MNKQKIKAFTLVELIVVITILAILGTIAFISLQGYSTSARDSTRISDLSSMKSSLELFQLDAGKYPLPTNGVNITYSGATVWTQGIFGENVLTNTDKLDKIPLDPVTDKEYTYSVTQARTNFQLGGIMESSDISYINREVLAAEITATAYVTGNYNGLMTKSYSGELCNILAIPSIITNDTSITDINQITASGSFVYRGQQNLPGSFKDSKFKYNGGFNFKPNNILAYSDTGSCINLIKNTNSGTLSRLNLLKGLQGVYSGSIVKNDGEIKNILALNIDLNSPSNEVKNYASNFVNNVLGSKLLSHVSTNQNQNTQTGSNSNVDNVVLFLDGENGFNDISQFSAVSSSSLSATGTTSQKKNGSGSIFINQFGGGISWENGYVKYHSRTDYNLGTTSDYTIEYWFKNSGYGCYGIQHIKRGGNWSIGVDNNGKAYFKIGATIYYGNSTIGAGNWGHIALTRENGITKLFVNNVLEKTLTGTLNMESVSNTSEITLGRDEGYANGCASTQMYLDNIKIAKSAIYTSINYSSSTLFMVHGNNSYADYSVYNNQPSSTLSATVSTSEKVFGAGSININQFVGGISWENGYVKYPSKTQYNFGTTSDFTIEYWFKNSGYGCYGIQHIKRGGNWSLGVLNTGVPYFKFGATIYSATSTINTNNWAHIALVRSAGVTKLYVNGNAQNTISTSLNMENTGNNLEITLGRDEGYANGCASTTMYLDELRITNTAEYTSNFTPPSDEY